MKRRFSITEDQGYLIIISLDTTIEILEEEQDDLGLSPREKITVAQLRSLRHKIGSYNWEK